MFQLQRDPDLLHSQEAVDHLWRTWSADPSRAAWAADRYPELPVELALRSVARAMWASAVPNLDHYRARPRQLRRIRRRWIDTLGAGPFPRWKAEAERHHDARPFTWESEREMAERLNRAP